jgi:hypothetical protein
VAEGFLLAADQKKLIAEAEASDVLRWPTPPDQTAAP